MTGLTTILGFELLTNLFVKGLPLALVVGAGGFFLRRSAPRVRCTYWTLGGVALLVLPLLSLGLPGWGGGLLQPPASLTAPGVVSLPPVAWVAGIWALGAAILGGRVLRDLLQVYRVGRAVGPAPGPKLWRAADRARVRIGLRRSVRFRISDAAAVPSTHGWIRPVVVLPARARGWPEERLRAVLLHEMAHVARHDFPALMVVELARVLLWPNPLVWYLVQRVRRDQDMACDAIAVRAVASATAYARQLVAVAREFLTSRALSSAALPVVGASGVAERVRNVLALDHGPMPDPRVGWWRGTLLVGVIASLLTIAALDPWATCTAAPVEGEPSLVPGTAAVIDARTDRELPRGTDTSIL